MIGNFETNEYDEDDVEPEQQQNHHHHQKYEQKMFESIDSLEQEQNDHEEAVSPQPNDEQSNDDYVETVNRRGDSSTNSPSVSSMSSTSETQNRFVYNFLTTKKSFLYLHEILYFICMAFRKGF